MQVRQPSRDADSVFQESELNPFFTSTLPRPESNQTFTRLFNVLPPRWGETRSYSKGSREYILVLEIRDSSPYSTLWGEYVVLWRSAVAWVFSTLAVSALWVRLFGVCLGRVSFGKEW